MKTTTLILSITAILGILVTNGFSGVSSKPSHNMAISACTKRTGLKPGDIIDYNSRNEGCVIDCTTRQAQVMSYFATEGKACHQNETFRCHLGKCKSPDDGIDYPSDLQNLKIKIKSAHVPDEDDLPTAGSSDTFVTVLIEHNGDPNFNDGDLVCHTYVVQDNSYPKWKNFTCEPPPLRTTTMLKFIATDSDKPSEHIDILGTASESVEYLLNRGPVKLGLQRPENNGAYYYVEVDIYGEEFKRP